MDHTISELQAQIDQLSLALHQWRSTQDHLEPMEQRLTELTDRCAEILNQWIATDQRHARAVGQVEERLGEWNDIEARLQREAGDRLRQLEATIEHEWKTLRQLHEEPIRQLREQAAALGETCRSAANLALKSFENAETRIAALEIDLQTRLTRLSDDVKALAARTQAPQPALPPAGATAAPFPLDGVMRIHEELREGAPGAPAAVETAAPRQLPEASALTTRLESLEREMTSEREEVRATVTRTERMRRSSRLLLVALIAAVVVGGGYAVILQRQVNEQLNAATARAAAAEREAASATAAATRQVEATRADAQRQIAEARQTAEQARIVSDILAAPDLVRLALVGTDAAAGASAQVLWSRSRGLVLSASRLPAAPGGSAYQVWFMSEAAPVSAGVFTADRDGRASVVAENPQSLPPRVTGVIVTIEPDGGSAAPTGTTVLARPAPPQL